MNGFDIAILTTTSGVGLVVGLLLQFFVKPYMRTLMDDDRLTEAAYRLWMNVSAGILGILAAIAAQFALSDALTAEVLLTAVFTGLVGGLAAIGGHQTLDNAARVRKNRSG